MITPRPIIRISRASNGIYCYMLVNWKDYDIEWNWRMEYWVPDPNYIKRTLTEF